MGHPKTPRTNALFGIFLQDIREIRQRHPRSFGKKYYAFDYIVQPEDGYCLFIEPDTVTKGVKKEIMQAFDMRLNQDLLPLKSRNKSKQKTHHP